MRFHCVPQDHRRYPYCVPGEELRCDELPCGGFCGVELRAGANQDRTVCVPKPVDSLRRCDNDTCANATEVCVAVLLVHEQDGYITADHRCINGGAIERP